MRWFSLKRTEFECKKKDEWWRLFIDHSSMEDFWSRLPSSIEKRQFAYAQFNLNKDKNELVPSLEMMSHSQAKAVVNHHYCCLADVELIPTETQLSILKMDNYGEYIKEDSLKKVFAECGSNLIMQNLGGGVELFTKNNDLIIAGISAIIGEQLSLSKFEVNISANSMAAICNRAENGLRAYVSDVGMVSGSIQIPFYELTNNKLANTFTLTIDKDSQVLSEVSLQKNFAKPVTDTKAFSFVVFFSVVALLLMLLIAFIYAVFF